MDVGELSYPHTGSTATWILIKDTVSPYSPGVILKINSAILLYPKIEFYHKHASILDKYFARISLVFFFDHTQH